MYFSILKVKGSSPEPALQGYVGSGPGYGNFISYPSLSQSWSSSHSGLHATPRTFQVSASLYLLCPQLHPSFFRFYLFI